jgi:carbonic anhydrase
LVARNPGGHVQAALPNLLALDALLGVENILVIGHTDCGARNFDEENLAAQKTERAPGYEAEVRGMSFGKVHSTIFVSV